MATPSFLRTWYFRAVVRLALALLLIGYIGWIGMNKSGDWHQPESPYRISIEVSGVAQTSSPATVSLVIPREDLPQPLADTVLDLQLTKDDGEPIDFYRSPVRSNTPVVLWWPNLTSEQDRDLLLYLRPASPDQTLDHVVSSPNETPSYPFLLFDTFEDPELPSWEQKPLWYPDEAIFPWMELMPSTSRILPDSESGYTIELMAEDIETGNGGAAIVVSSEGTAISWGRLYGEMFQIQIQTEGLLETTIAAKTTPNKPTYIRLDVPRTSGDLVRFIINGKIVYQAPLPRPVAGPLRLWLMRRGSDGDTYFRWIAVRPYQQNEPVVKLGEVETR